MKSRRVELDVLYLNTDISKYINNDLLSFKYSDNAKGTLDDINIGLKDKTHKWINEWYPTKGSKLKATIKTINWNMDNENKLLNCGDFLIDEISIKGPPNCIAIKGISTPLNNNFSDMKRNYSWNKISLKELATQIAKRYNIQLFYDCSINPIYSTLEQTNSTDMNFLNSICEKESLSLKISMDSLIIFDEEIYEKKEVVAVLTKEKIENYSFSSTLFKTAYKASRIKYHSTEGTELEYIYNPNNLDINNNKLLDITETADSYEEAKRLAKRKLQEYNRKEHKGSITIKGNTLYAAGQNIQIEDLGVYNGKYFIDKVTHSIQNGYTVSLDIHKIME